MKLWHYELLPYLPNSQLIAQKRECDLIWKDIAAGKQTNHILINYIWQYDDYINELSVYYWLLKKEFKKRDFTFRASVNAQQMIKLPDDVPFKNHHNNIYLIQCFYNLQEKYMRGQKDFSYGVYKALLEFVEDLL
jgi:uncharacterized protein (TIGR02328 family)